METYKLNKTKVNFEVKEILSNLNYQELNFGTYRQLYSLQVSLKSPSAWDSKIKKIRTFSKTIQNDRFLLK